MALVLLALAGTGATALASTFHDRRGRPIQIVSAAAGADAAEYASILSDAPHGAEIASVRVRIMDSGQIAGACGQAAAGCYDRSRRTLVVPTGKRQVVEQVLLHEYGHHLDAHRRGYGPELNGGRAWFRARGLASLIGDGKIGYGNAISWDHRIHELWADDYMGLSVDTGACSQIAGCETANIRRAMLLDILGRRLPVKPQATTNTEIDVGIGGKSDHTVSIPFTGGQLRIALQPATAFPEDGSLCRLELYREAALIDLASGPGTVRLQREAVGGDYVVSVRDSGVGCRGVLTIDSPSR